MPPWRSLQCWRITSVALCLLGIYVFMSKSLTGWRSRLSKVPRPFHLAKKFENPCICIYTLLYYNIHGFSNFIAKWRMSGKNQFFQNSNFIWPNVLRFLGSWDLRPVKKFWQDVNPWRHHIGIYVLSTGLTGIYVLSTRVWQGFTSCQLGFDRT